MSLAAVHRRLCSNQTISLPHDVIIQQEEHRVFESFSCVCLLLIACKLNADTVLGAGVVNYDHHKGPTTSFNQVDRMLMA
jgi:hypothetical protein